MRRSVVAFVVISIAAVLMLPVGLFDEIGYFRSEATDARQPLSAVTKSLSYPSPLNTSHTVAEYSMVSRALMLPGGSTYSTLADMNKDGRMDLIVAVSDAKVISLFYGQTDGQFPSCPSHNITLGRNPIWVKTLDPFADGKICLLVIEARTSDLDTERMLILNYSTDDSYSEYQNLSLYVTASSFVVGHFNGDTYPDVAYSCPGFSPTTSPGVVEVRFGPAFSSSVQFNAGKGSNSIVTGNFSSDEHQDLAISNYYDSTILVFFYPFSFGNAPDYTLSTSASNPVKLACEDLNSDDSDDIAAVAYNPSRLMFYFQSMGNLQTSPDSTYSRLLANDNASYVSCEDVNSDGRSDLLMLSVVENKTFGILQRSSAPIWPQGYDFAFPTAGNPRHILVGSLDSDSNTDIAVSSARNDWSGSSIAIYPARMSIAPMFSNSNSTIWGDRDLESSSVEVGDIDGDGRNDLVALYPEGQLLEVVKLPGMAKFQKSLEFVPDKVVVAELNGDSCSDILITHTSGNVISLFFGQSDLSGPLQSVELTCGAPPMDVAIGHLDGDDRSDVVAVTQGGLVDIFFNSGNPTDPFPGANELVVASGVSIEAVVVGDFNSDGRDDIAYSLPSLYINVSFQRETNPYFLSQADTTLLHTTGGIFAELWSGDVNGDSKTDIAAMKAADTVVCLFNQDHFTTSRTPYLQLELPDVPEFVSVSDFTEDGLVDMVATFNSADLLFLHKQSAGEIPADPSMVFVTGASPNWAVAGILGQENVQSMVVSDSRSHSFSVWREINIPPVVTIVVTSIGPFDEFDLINLTAEVDSYHPAVRFEWQFEASTGEPFVPDETISSSNEVTHLYGHPGKFTVLVRATVSDNSSGFGQVELQVHDVVPAGVFDDFVTWQRVAANTSAISFNASALAARYPDIMQTSVVFGDGTTQEILGGPVNVFSHQYEPIGDYVFVLNVTDDEWNKLTLSKTLKLNAPVILLTSPAQGVVVKAGVPIKFFMSDDSLPLLWARYSLNGGQSSNFSAEWEIATDEWTDGSYLLEVQAADRDGNIAVKRNIAIVIDSLPPVLDVLWEVASVYGGGSVNISVQVADPHVDDDSIFLNVKLPGSKTYTQVSLNSAGNGLYYAIVEVPKRSGTLMFNVTVDDLAHNSVSSAVYSVEVKLHFIDVAWPFLLVLAILAALGTAGYFVREAKIAVDETFVIYNDGRLIAHSTRHLKPGMDDQVLSGMFVAIQDFVKESFKDVTSFTLRKLEFGEKSVLIEKGDHLFLAVILHGKASKKVASKMQRIVDEIEEVYYPKLKGWDGDLDSLRGVADIAKKLYSKAPLLPPFLRKNN